MKKGRFVAVSLCSLFILSAPFALRAEETEVVDPLVMVSASVDATRTRMTITMNRYILSTSLGVTDFEVNGVRSSSRSGKNDTITLNFEEPLPNEDLTVRIFGDGTSSGSPNGVRDFFYPSIWTVDQSLTIPGGGIQDLSLSYTYVEGVPHVTVSGVVAEGFSGFPITQGILIERHNFGEVGLTPFTISSSFADVGSGPFSVTLPYPTTEHFNKTSTTNILVRLTISNEEGGSALFDSPTLSVIDIPPEEVPPEEVDPCIEDTCVSNVLFLPGIKGSRLYMANEGCGEVVCEDRLWEPGDGNLLQMLVNGSLRKDVEELYMNPDGTSIRSDIYVKKGEVLSEVLGSRYYASVIETFNEMQDSGVINEWEAVPYDWRLSLFDLVSYGAEVEEGIISYTTATSTPYIEQTLRRLAQSSQTGKVTIVAHSNGGLVTKALLSHLGESETSALVDSIIFVGVPQMGAPRAIGALLYGDDEGLPAKVPFLVSEGIARALAENSPMPYHLLPSQAYFETVQDAHHPVGSFINGGEAYEKERSTYGFAITNWNELSDLLLAKEGGRGKPMIKETQHANILNETLVAYGKQVHDQLDSWVPPESVKLYQIAGWGEDTVAGIEFFEIPQIVGSLTGRTSRGYRPVFTEDGDGVVPTGSALMKDENLSNIHKYWVNLPNLSSEEDFIVEHESLFEAEKVLSTVRKVVLGENLEESSFLGKNIFVTNNEKKKLRFFLHSPLTLGIYDSNGNYTGLSTDGIVSEAVPGVTYGQFGEVQYIIVPAGENYQLVLQGLSEGTFSLQIEEVTGETQTSLTTIAHVPTNAETVATLTIDGEGNPLSALSVDFDGDGETDELVTIIAGDTVVYEEKVEEEVSEVTESAESVSSFVGGGGSGSAIVVSTESETLTPIIPAEQESVLGESSVQVEDDSEAESLQTQQATFATIVEESEISAGSVVEESTQMESTNENSVSLSTIPQTASVYDSISQQGFVQKLLINLYTIFINVWNSLKTNVGKLFFW